MKLIQRGGLKLDSAIDYLRHSDKPDLDAIGTLLTCLGELVKESGKAKEHEDEEEDISTIEACRRQLENIVYCCNQEPPVLVDSIRAYAETALKRINSPKSSFCPSCLGSGEQWFHGSRIHGGPSYIGKCVNCDGTGTH